MKQRYAGIVNLSPHELAMQTMFVRHDKISGCNFSEVPKVCTYKYRIPENSFHYDIFNPKKQ